MTDHDLFLEVTSVYDVSSLRQIAEGMKQHARYVEDDDEKKVMENVAIAINDFLALRNRRWATRRWNRCGGAA